MVADKHVHLFFVDHHVDLLRIICSTAIPVSGAAVMLQMCQVEWDDF